MSFGENFLLMDIMPNTTSRKSESKENSNMTFYFEKIMFCKDYRVYMTGTVSHPNFDSSAP